MEGFKRLSEVDPSVPEPKSDDEIIVLSRLGETGFVVDMVEEEEPRVIGKELIGQMGNCGRKQWIRN
jgi:hypothetical protein